MNNKQRETFKMLCDTLREAVRYDMEDLHYSEDSGNDWVIADQAIKDKVDLIRIMLRDSGFVVPEDFKVEEIFRSCLLCCDQCESCAEWAEIEGLTGFAACCYDNVIGYGLAIKHETPKEEEETLETDNTIELDPYKIIESYKKVVENTLDDLYEELNYTTYAKLAERLRKNDLWK